MRTFDSNLQNEARAYAPTKGLSLKRVSCRSDLASAKFICEIETDDGRVARHEVDDEIYRGGAHARQEFLDELLGKLSRE